MRVQCAFRSMLGGRERIWIVVILVLPTLRNCIIARQVKLLDVDKIASFDNTALNHTFLLSL